MALDAPTTRSWSCQLTWRTVWPRYVMTEASCLEFAFWPEEDEDELPFFPFGLPPLASKCRGTLCHLKGHLCFQSTFISPKSLPGSDVQLTSFDQIRAALVYPVQIFLGKCGTPGTRE